MCYRCELCNAVVPVKNVCEKFVIKRRIRHYSIREKANAGYATKSGRLIHPIRKSNKRSDRTDDPGGTGWEIVQESPVCKVCSERIRSE